MFFMLSHSHSEQDIYDNFTSISGCMVECAIMDSKVILRRDINEFEIQNKSLANEYDLITATELDSNFRYTKFYSLGLLLAIYKDYKLNYNPATRCNQLSANWVRLNIATKYTWICYSSVYE